MKQEIKEELLIKYVIEGASNEEKLQVEAWMDIDIENKRELERIKFIVDNSKELAPLSPSDTDVEWARFKQIRESKEGIRVVPLRSHTRWLQIASILFLICGAWAGYKFLADGSRGDVVTFATKELPQRKLLPDGSTVFLNKYSKISFAGNFGKNRSVELTGEAFFAVIHDQSSPFSVKAADVTIKDVGTSFNVFSRGKSVKVLVENGIVEVSARKTLARLSKNDIITVNASGDLTEKIKIADHLHDYYRTGIFSANHTPLSRLIDVLNEAYDTNIVIERRELADIPITGNFKTGSIDQILKVIQMSTPELVFKKEGSKIILGKR